MEKNKKLNGSKDVIKLDNSSIKSEININSTENNDLEKTYDKMNIENNGKENNINNNNDISKDN